MSHSQTSSIGGDSIRRASELTSKQNAIYANVVSDFGPSIARLAAAFEADRTHQEDLLQDIHIALWRSFATFANQCSLKTWVYRVAHNTAATHVRKQRRARRSQSMSLIELDDFKCDSDGERRSDESELLSTVYKLVQKLKPIDREVLLLYLEGVEAAEIAEVVGISRSNVAQKVHRSKRVLQRYLLMGDKP